ncbi:MAG: protein translocase subunit SecD [Candidatus Magasanikbacteria bacterium]|nr:protein translocase subunit SecD [Candidatus Magasanikbacteria bacterium]|tara:strand:+ start:521 stop:2560 length:2040 start_codon:yes stop_codon:yes gene_type:complete
MKNQKEHIRSKMRWGIVGIFILLIGALSFVVPQYANRAITTINAVTHVGLPTLPESPFRLGLDLQGGAHLVYKANVAGIEPGDQPQAVEGVRDAVERRVNGTGVSEPNVQTARVGDEFRLIVDLPGIEDVNEAIKMIGETPILDFQEQNNEPPRELTEEEKQQITETNENAAKESQDIQQKLAGGAVFADLVTEHSDDEGSKNNAGNIGFLESGIPGLDPLYIWASSHKEGDISEKPIETEFGYHILQRGAQKDGEPKVSAKHILVCYFGAKACASEDVTKEQALQKAQDIFSQVNGENFDALAKEYSTDASNKDTGGDLGTFAKGAMVPAFEAAVFDAEVGQIVGPVETDFGYHVIYKTAEELPLAYELSHIMKRKLTQKDILPPSNNWKPTKLSGKQLDRAAVAIDQQTGSVQVTLNFDKEGTQLFKEITERNLNKPVAIFLDGAPISIPTVQSVISGGEAVITGSFSMQEARLLAQRLNTGALPVPIELISQQAIGASLGAESLQKSLRAGFIAIILVMLFMIFYYRLPGVLATLSLTLYISLVLAVFKGIGVTLTLAGIAGFILSIGMAVDANILIFERVKEELKAGKSLKAAVEEGFLRAWTSIRDGNISTLITCVLLVGFGSSFVQGFAATLSIGVLLSMFSAITITRAFLRFVVPWFSRYGSWLFLGYSNKE